MKKQLFLFLALFFPFMGLAITVDSLKFVDAAAFPVIGKGFSDTQSRYERLPAALENQTRKPVWNLSKNSSGLAVRFRTASTAIGARWEVTGDVTMNHFAPTGIKGLDLYCLKDGKWQFIKSAQPAGKLSAVVIVQNMTGEEMEYMLYLPLYDGLKSLEIGITKQSEVKMPVVNSPRTGNPVVFYGTSITQGGCANRTGMAYPSILSRMLDRETINLGFSGNGQLDYEVAKAMATIPASCYVIDCLPNVSPEQISDKYVRFLEIIREKQPKTPIILVENILYTHMFFDQSLFTLINRKNELLAQIFREQKKSGDKNIYYVKADKLIGNDREATVDGVHLTDLGFLRMAENLYPAIRKRVR